MILSDNFEFLMDFDLTADSYNFFNYNKRCIIIIIIIWTSLHTYWQQAPTTIIII